MKQLTCDSAPTSRESAEAATTVDHGSEASREELRSALQRGIAQSQLESLHALWRIARLDSLTIEVAAFEASKWKPETVKWAPLRGHCVAYASCPDDVDQLAQCQDLYASGMYVVPAKLQASATAKYPHDGGWHQAENGTATEGDVLTGRVLAIDIDPKRSRGTNANKEENRNALRLGWQIREYLVGKGLPSNAYAYGMSGNGCMSLVALDVAWSHEVKSLRQDLLAALQTKYGNSTLDIDQTMANGDRYVPAFGTTKKKGPSIKGDDPRPQRRSWLVAPETVEALDLDAFTRLVKAVTSDLTGKQREEFDRLRKKAGVKSTAPFSATAERGDTLGACNAVPVDVVAHLLGIDPQKPECPGCGATKGIDCLRIKNGDGRNIIKCQHATCGSRAWSPVSLVAKCVANVDDLKGKSESVRQVIDWFVEHHLIEPPKRRSRKQREVTDAELLRIVMPTEDELDAMGVGVDDGTDHSLESLDKEAPETEEVVQHPPLTDLGNADRLVAEVGSSAEYIPEWRTWMVCRGGRWIRDTEGIHVKTMAERAVRAMPLEALDADPKDRKRILDWAEQSQSKNRFNAMCELARHKLHATSGQYDQHHTLLQTPNGVVDLRTGELRDHDPRLRLTQQTTVEYDPDADTTMVDRFLERVQPEEAMRTYLWRLLGYSLTGLVGEHVFPVHHGVGRNGKGTLVNAVQRLMGDYAIVMADELIMETRGDQHPTGLAALKGKRFAIASEVKKGRLLNVALVKRLVGGDTITARGMRQDYFDFEPTHQPHLITNHKPVITDIADPIWERVHLIPWEVVVPPSERDPGLLDRLATDPGLFRRLVKGARDYLRDGLRVPDTVRAATQAYKDESDKFADFVDECLVLDATAETSSKAIYQTWKKWALDNGLKPGSNKGLTQALNERAIGQPGKGNIGSKRGISVRRGVVLAGYERDVPSDLQAAIDELTADAERIDQLRDDGSFDDGSFSVDDLSDDDFELDR